MSKHPRGPRSGQAMVYHLDASHTGATLAGALRALVEGASWNEVKRWIAERRVQVNGNLCLDEARRVAERDVVKLWPQSLPKPVEATRLRIAYHDPHLLVVEKPAGVTSVRHVAERRLSTRRRQLQPTLEELLPPALAKLQRLRWPPLPPKGMNRGRRLAGRSRPGSSLPIHNAKKLPPELQVFPVHRLDRETSGLMLFARTRQAEQKLLAMFRRHAIDREYVGVCLGHIEPRTIESWVVRDRGDGLRGSIAADASADSAASDDTAGGGAAGQAKRAVTHIVSSEPFVAGADRREEYSLVRCKLETGRTHQIRIHLAEAGHMLCGERIYARDLAGGKTRDASGAPRHALHSDRLAFEHPITGERVSLDMPLPRDLAQWLERLRGTSAASGVE